MNARHRYPPNWKELATACKEQARWCCEECHVLHKSERISKRTGLFYPVYLHAAHIGRYTARPRLKALCPSCHAKMDWQLRQRERIVTLERKKHRVLLGVVS